MSVDVDLDPFSLVYRALWEQALLHPVIQTLVPVGNRLQFDTHSRNVLKDDISTADLPELMLLTDGTQGVNLQRTTCDSSIERSYLFVVSTGDLRLQEYLYPVEWALYCAMAGWQDTLTQLTWKGRKFVERCYLGDTTEGFNERDRNRGIRGWSTAWRCNVAMTFKTTDLREDLNHAS